MDNHEEILLLLFLTIHFILGAFVFGFCMENRNLNDHYVHIKHANVFLLLQIETNILLSVLAYSNITSVISSYPRPYLSNVC